MSPHGYRVTLLDTKQKRTAGHLEHRRKNGCQMLVHVTNDAGWLGIRVWYRDGGYLYLFKRQRGAV